jgi:hypothetical protein
MNKVSPQSSSNTAVIRYDQFLPNRNLECKTTLDNANLALATVYVHFALSIVQDSCEPLIFKIGICIEGGSTDSCKLCQNQLGVLPFDAIVKCKPRSCYSPKHIWTTSSSGICSSKSISLYRPYISASQSATRATTRATLQKVNAKQQALTSYSPAHFLSPAVAHRRHRYQQCTSEEADGVVYMMVEMICGCG